MFSIIFHHPISDAQGFEGKLKVVKETLTDTVYYEYYVKENMVRIDEKDKNGKIFNYKLVDLEKNTIKTVNPERKLYMLMSPQSSQLVDSDKLKVIKSPNSKMINGYKCYQWRVRNEEENTEIAFWVAKDNFYFFDDFLRVYGDKEKETILYFLYISGNEGFLPMLAVERSLLRKKRMTLRVENIEKQKLKSSLFEVPEYFSVFDR